jgi:hypothetical protein
MHRDNKLKDHRKRSSRNGKLRYGARSNFNPYQLQRDGDRRSQKRREKRAVKTAVDWFLGLRAP